VQEKTQSAVSGLVIWQENSVAAKSRKQDDGVQEAV
jgi:hypothetical protein